MRMDENFDGWQELSLLAANCNPYAKLNCIDLQYPEKLTDEIIKSYLVKRCIINKDKEALYDRELLLKLFRSHVSPQPQRNVSIKELNAEIKGVSLKQDQSSTRLERKRKMDGGGATNDLTVKIPFGGKIDSKLTKPIKLKRKNYDTSLENKIETTGSSTLQRQDDSTDSDPRSAPFSSGDQGYFNKISENEMPFNNMVKRDGQKQNVLKKETLQVRIGVGFEQKRSTFVISERENKDLYEDSLHEERDEKRFLHFEEHAGRRRLQEHRRERNENNDKQAPFIYNCKREPPHNMLKNFRTQEMTTFKLGRNIFEDERKEVAEESKKVEMVNDRKTTRRRVSKTMVDFQNRVSIESASINSAIHSHLSTEEEPNELPLSNINITCNDDLRNLLPKQYDNESKGSATNNSPKKENHMVSHQRKVNDTVNLSRAICDQESRSTKDEKPNIEEIYELENVDSNRDVCNEKSEKSIEKKSNHIQSESSQKESVDANNEIELKIISQEKIDVPGQTVVNTATKIKSDDNRTESSDEDELNKDSKKGKNKRKRYKDDENGTSDLDSKKGKHKRKKKKKSKKSKRSKRKETDEQQHITPEQFASLKEKMKEEILMEIQEANVASLENKGNTSVIQKSDMVEETYTKEGKSSDSESSGLELDYSDIEGDDEDENQEEATEELDKHGFRTGITVRKDDNITESNEDVTRDNEEIELFNEEQDVLDMELNEEQQDNKADVKRTNTDKSNSKQTRATNREERSKCEYKRRDVDRNQDVKRERFSRRNSPDRAPSTITEKHLSDHHRMNNPPSTKTRDVSNKHNSKEGRENRSKGTHRSTGREPTDEGDDNARSSSNTDVHMKDSSTPSNTKASTTSLATSRTTASTAPTTNRRASTASRRRTTPPAEFNERHGNDNRPLSQEEKPKDDGKTVRDEERTGNQHDGIAIAKKVRDEVYKRGNFWNSAYCKTDTSTNTTPKSESIMSSAKKNRMEKDFSSQAASSEEKCLRRSSNSAHSVNIRDRPTDIGSRLLNIAVASYTERDTTSSQKKDEIKTATTRSTGEEERREMKRKDSIRSSVDTDKFSRSNERGRNEANLTYHVPSVGVNNNGNNMKNGFLKGDIKTKSVHSKYNDSEPIKQNRSNEYNSKRTCGSRYDGGYHSRTEDTIRRSYNERNSTSPKYKHHSESEEPTNGKHSFRTDNNMQRWEDSRVRYSSITENSINSENSYKRNDIGSRNKHLNEGTEYRMRIMQEEHTNLQTDDSKYRHLNDRCFPVQPEYPYSNRSKDHSLTKSNSFVSRRRDSFGGKDSSKRRNYEHSCDFSQTDKYDKQNDGNQTAAIKRRRTTLTTTKSRRNENMQIQHIDNTTDDDMMINASNFTHSKKHNRGIHKSSRRVSGP